MEQDARSIPLSDEERRALGAWAADCAERVLSLFEAGAPADSRPRAAIEGIRAYARGEKRTARLRALVWAAYDAARAVGEAAAATAARAAGTAAGSAYLHPLATPHQSKHIFAPAMYAALARELAPGGDPSAGDEEIRWAIAHAPAAVRAIVRRLPPRSPGRSHQDALYYQLDVGLRG